MLGYSSISNIGICTMGDGRIAGNNMHNMQKSNKIEIHTKMRIQIREITVGQNPRKEFNGEKIKKLATSMREIGLIQDITVTPNEKGYTLVCGHRRLLAAKVIGWQEIEAKVAKPEKETEKKLVENIHRVDLNPIEEGNGFIGLGGSAKEIAKKISKQEMYVERRMIIVGSCSKKVQEALKEKKIQIGHALLMARFEKKVQDEELKKIIEYGMSVKRVKEDMESIDEINNLAEAFFDKTDCKGCKYNGGEQALLYDTGDSLKNLCLNPKCYNKKTEAKIKKRTEIGENKGFRVIPQGQEGCMWKDHEHVNKITKGIKKEMKESPEKFTVTFEQHHGRPLKETLWRKEDDAVKKEKSPEERAGNLKRKIAEYKEKWLIEQERKKLTDERVDDINLFFLLNGLNCNEQPETVKLLGIQETDWGGMVTKGILEKITTAVKTRAMLLEQARVRIEHLNRTELEMMAPLLGVDIKEYVLDEEFLKLHTIAELKELGKEQGIKLKGSAPKSDYIASVKITWPKGKIPKAMERKLE